MTYFRIVTLLLIIFFSFNQNVYAYNWHEICGWITGCPNKCPPNKQGIIQLDIDKESINVYGDSIYYALGIQKESGEPKVVIIQIKGNKAGVSKTYRWSDYEHESQKYGKGAYERIPAQNLKEVSQDSFIYKANSFVINYVNYETQFWMDYNDSLEKKLTEHWTPTEDNTVAWLEFMINKKGEIISTINVSADNRIARSHALQALNSILPLAPLPKWYTKDSRKIVIEFLSHRNYYQGETHRVTVHIR